MRIRDLLRAFVVAGAATVFVSPVVLASDTANSKQETPAVETAPPADALDITEAPPAEGKADDAQNEEAMRED